MFPAVPMNDVPNIRAGHAEAFRYSYERIAFGMGLSDKGDVFLGELGLVMLRSLSRRWNRTTAFLAHITQIILLCAEKQVIGPHATRVIAAMANACIVWNWAISQFPRKTMGQNHSASAEGCKPSSIWAHRADPLPAIRTKFYAFPELRPLALISQLRHGHTANVTTDNLTMWKDFDMKLSHFSDGGTNT